MSMPPRKRIAITAAILVGAVFGMTALGFAAVPLYRAFCQATGYGGTTRTARTAPSRVLAQRILVRFDTNVSSDLPITFVPKQPSETLHIGETGLAFFHVRNESNETLTARATYNVTPHSAGQYFAKLECFCFQDRTLAPGEQADLPVVFFVDPDIENDPETRGLDAVTLSYTYFRVAPGAAAPAG
jgi:cytochrome c oxidase assembly protein subunit 11